MPRTKKRPRKSKRTAANSYGLPDTMNVNGTQYPLAVEIHEGTVNWHLDRRRRLLAVNLIALMDLPAGKWLPFYRKAAREAAAAERDDPDKNDLYGPMI